MFQRIKDLNRLVGKNLLAIDTETTGLDVKKDNIIMISFSDGIDSYAIYTEDILKNKKNLEILIDILTNEKIIKIFQNVKYDSRMFKYDAGITINRFIKSKEVFVHELMLMSHLVDENSNNRLKDLAVRYIDKDANAWEIKVKNYIKENRIDVKVNGYSDIPEELLIPYACSDANYTFKLFEKFKSILEREKLWDLYLNELALLECVIDIEDRGVLIDKKRILKSIPPLNEKLTKLEDDIFKLTPEKFNINSSEQIASILFDKMGYKRLKGDSTDEEVLSEYNTDLTNMIIEYRNTMKLKNTYFESILDKLDEENVLHCNFNQLGTRTGRFSSSEPNLQNIPHDGGVREIFIPRPNTKLFFFDYKQIEMCLFAHYAKDSRMIRYIKEGKSLHKTLASDLFSIPYDEVKKNTEEYMTAKQINFGIIYCMGAATLGKKLNKTEQYAKQILNRMYLMYPSIKLLRKQVSDVIKNRGYIFNFFGRRRRLESKDAYKGVNALIQGVVGDMLKYIMVRVHNYFKDNNLKSHIVLTIHDELIIEIPNEEEYIVTKIKELMTDFNEFNLRVPISIDTEVTNTNWGEKHSYNEAI